MMQLQSDKMALSHDEQHWLPWFGKTGKLAMRWACRCNRDRLTAMESAFESFAQTRKELLIQWCEQQWRLLESLAELLPLTGSLDSAWLADKQSLLPDASELFVLDAGGGAAGQLSPAGGGALPADGQALDADPAEPLSTRPLQG